MTRAASSTSIPLKAEAKAWSGLVGLDLAKVATSGQSSTWDEKPWVWNEGYSTLGAAEARYHVVCVDFGVKRNILRLFAGLDCKVTVVPASTSAEDILALNPDGIFLSNGPGDPAATGEYAVPVIQNLIKSNKPLFGICLGHQMLGLALGGEDRKDAPGPPWRQPSGQGLHHRQGRDRLDESRLRGRFEVAAGRR